MLHLQAPSHRRVSPFSTGQHPRNCRVCGAAFAGLGTLCPKHLGQHARQRAQELQAQRIESTNIIAAREFQAIAQRPARVEWKDELDA